MGTHIGFDKYFVGLVPSFTCSVIIIASMVIILTSTREFRKNLNSIKLYPGILIIIGTIVWIIFINNMTNIVQYNSSFWESLTPGFGVIGLFIGGGLLIIGYVLAKIFGEPFEEPIEIIIPEAEYKPQKKEEIDKYLEEVELKESTKKVSPLSKVISGNFCINCGKPVLPTWNVCAYCGQRILDVTPLQESVINSDVKPVKHPPTPSQTSLKAQKKEESEKKIVQIKKIKLYKSKKLKEEEPKPVEKAPKQPIDVPISHPISKKKAEPEKTKKIEPQVCPFCNSQIDVKQNYCQYCGYVVKK